MAKKKLTETDEERSIPQAEGETLKVAVGERAPRTRSETDGELVGQEARSTQNGENVGASETVGASASSGAPKKRASRARRKAGDESGEIGEISARDDGDCRSFETADASSPREDAPKKRAPRARRKASAVVDSPDSLGEQASVSTVARDESIASPGQNTSETPSKRKRKRENSTGDSGGAASERGVDEGRQSAFNAASSGDLDEVGVAEHAPDGALDVQWSDLYQTYEARFANTWAGNAESYIKIDYFNNNWYKERLADGHTMETLFKAHYTPPIQNAEAKWFSAMEAGGTGFLITTISGERQNEITFLPNVSPQPANNWIWTRKWK